eukprot:Cvel_16388.t1-p1 / transcript=Cvel_16388.t1 / gene=Cvel_16388 / organism=Chromera_velia_CCMP2878 / gene_product=hypothetical protein / transcript_product=hypothetical protein / location=Cvel_scaffold1260:38021-50994(+) / protein_length=1904 / sequence_SO=supercontig / SO=protein_coding / is_pseudo=false
MFRAFESERQEKQHQKEKEEYVLTGLSSWFRFDKRQQTLVKKPGIRGLQDFEAKGKEQGGIQSQDGLSLEQFVILRVPEPFRAALAAELQEVAADLESGGSHMVEFRIPLLQSIRKRPSGMPAEFEPLTSQWRTWYVFHKRGLGVDWFTERRLVGLLRPYLDAELREGWGRYRDRADREYYWNELSGESRWNHPDHGLFLQLRDLWRQLLPVPSFSLSSPPSPPARFESSPLAAFANERLHTLLGTIETELHSWRGPFETPSPNENTNTERDGETETTVAFVHSETGETVYSRDPRETLKRQMQWAREIGTAIPSQIRERQEEAATVIQKFVRGEKVREAVGVQRVRVFVSSLPPESLHSSLLGSLGFGDQRRGRGGRAVNGGSREGEREWDRDPARDGRKNGLDHKGSPPSSASRSPTASEGPLSSRRDREEGEGGRERGGLGDGEEDVIVPTLEELAALPRQRLLWYILNDRGLALMQDSDPEENRGGDGEGGREDQGGGFDPTEEDRGLMWIFYKHLSVPIRGGWRFGDLEESGELPEEERPDGWTHPDEGLLLDVLALWRQAQAEGEGTEGGTRGALGSLFAEWRAAFAARIQSVEGNDEMEGVREGLERQREVIESMERQLHALLSLLPPDREGEGGDGGSPSRGGRGRKFQRGVSWGQDKFLYVEARDKRGGRERGKGGDGKGQKGTDDLDAAARRVQGAWRRRQTRNRSGTDEETQGHTDAQFEVVKQVLRSASRMMMTKVSQRGRSKSGKGEREGKKGVSLRVSRFLSLLFFRVSTFLVHRMFEGKSQNLSIDISFLQDEGQPVPDPHREMGVHSDMDHFQEDSMTSPPCPDCPVHGAVATGHGSPARFSWGDGSSSPDFPKSAPAPGSSPSQSASRADSRHGSPSRAGGADRDREKEEMVAELAEIEAFRSGDAYGLSKADWCVEATSAAENKAQAAGKVETIRNGGMTSAAAMTGAFADLRRAELTLHHWQSRRRNGNGGLEKQRSGPSASSLTQGTLTEARCEVLSLNTFAMLHRKQGRLHTAYKYLRKALALEQTVASHALRELIERRASLLRECGQADPLDAAHAQQGGEEEEEEMECPVHPRPRGGGAEGMSARDAVYSEGMSVDRERDSCSECPVHGRQQTSVRVGEEDQWNAGQTFITQAPHHPGGEFGSAFSPASPAVAFANPPRGNEGGIMSGERGAKGCCPPASALALCSSATSASFVLLAQTRLNTASVVSGLRRHPEALHHTLFALQILRAAMDPPEAVRLLGLSSLLAPRLGVRGGPEVLFGNSRPLTGLSGAMSHVTPEELNMDPLCDSWAAEVVTAAFRRDKFRTDFSLTVVAAVRSVAVECEYLMDSELAAACYEGAERFGRADDRQRRQAMWGKRNHEGQGPSCAASTHSGPPETERGDLQDPPPPTAPAPTAECPARVAFSSQPAVYERDLASPREKDDHPLGREEDEKGATIRLLSEYGGEGGRNGGGVLNQSGVEGLRKVSMSMPSLGGSALRPVGGSAKKKKHKQKMHTDERRRPEVPLLPLESAFERIRKKHLDQRLYVRDTFTNSDISELRCSHWTLSRLRTADRDARAKQEYMDRQREFTPKTKAEKQAAQGRPRSESPDANNLRGLSARLVYTQDRLAEATGLQRDMDVNFKPCLASLRQVAESLSQSISNLQRAQEAVDFDHRHQKFEKAKADRDRQKAVLFMSKHFPKASARIFPTEVDLPNQPNTALVGDSRKNATINRLRRHPTKPLKSAVTLPSLNQSHTAAQKQTATSAHRRASVALSPPGSPMLSPGKKQKTVVFAGSSAAAERDVNSLFSPSSHKLSSQSPSASKAAKRGTTITLGEERHGHSSTRGDSEGGDSIRLLSPSAKGKKGMKKGTSKASLRSMRTTDDSAHASTEPSLEDLPPSA